MSGWWRRKPKDDAPSRAGAAETKANDGHEAGWLPTIGSRAAEAVRTALEHMEADERAMCSEGLWRESGSSTAWIEGFLTLWRSSSGTTQELIETSSGTCHSMSMHMFIHMFALPYT